MSVVIYVLAAFGALVLGFIAYLVIDWYWNDR